MSASTIAYMAFTCVTHLACRLKLRKKRSLSPAVIREAQLEHRCSILKDQRKAKRYVVPSAATVKAD